MRGARIEHAGGLVANWAESAGQRACGDVPLVRRLTSNGCELERGRLTVDPCWE